MARPEESESRMVAAGAGRGKRTTVDEWLQKVNWERGRDLGTVRGNTQQRGTGLDLSGFDKFYACLLHSSKKKMFKDRDGT